MDPSQINKEIASRLKAGTVKHGPPAPPILKLLSEPCNARSAEWALGPLAEKLIAFARAADLSHPDICEVFDGALAWDGEFWLHTQELMYIADHCHAEGFCRTGPSLWKLGYELPREVARKIDVPAANRMNVRFLHRAEDRDAIRATKRMQKIDLHNLCSKGEDVWNAQPDDFRKFVRFDRAYEEELARVEKKAQRYADLGCTDLCGEIMKTVNTFRQQLEDSYYGFNRVTMTNAAVILAKMHKYTLYKPLLLAEFSPEREYRIIVEPYAFGGYQFVVGGSLLPWKSQPPIAYEPRVYPLHELQAPTGVREIVSLLESFPDAGGKPIFDHFGVIVPGLDYPNASNPSFLDEKDVVRSFDNVEDGKRSLDAVLIQNKHVTPVLVGERDGKCYFISYFM